MKWKEFDIAEFLINLKKMGAPIEDDLLFQNFTKILKQKQQQEQQQKKQQQQAAALNNNNSSPTPNMNLNTNNNTNTNHNNNNIYNKNHNHKQIVANNVAAAAANGQQQSTSAADGSELTNNISQRQLFEQMAARRSLAARLQHLQHPQLHQQQIHMMPSPSAASMHLHSPGSKMRGHMPNVMMVSVYFGVFYTFMRYNYTNLWPYVGCSNIKSKANRFKIQFQITLQALN